MVALLVDDRLANGVGRRDAEEKEQNEREKVVERVVGDAPEQMEARHGCGRRILD